MIRDTDNNKGKYKFTRTREVTRLRLIDSSEPREVFPEMSSNDLSHKKTFAASSYKDNKSSDEKIFSETE